MQDVRKTSARWRIGSMVGIVGLAAFVVLAVLVIVGMFVRSQGLVELFPWALGAFAVGIIGMSVARTVKTPEDLEEEAAEQEVRAAQALGAQD